MVGFLVVAVNYLWELFRLWLHTIFVVPFQTTDMLWLLVPVWASWFFAEFFQEKTGTSFGNAITNSVVVLWGSIDCTRQTLKLMADHTITNSLNIALRFALIGLIFIYGVIIILWGWKTKGIIKYLGRIREVTYVFVIFTPMFYDAIPLSLDLLIAAVLFFPLFYFGIELINRYTPNPKAVVQDINDTVSSAPETRPAAKAHSTTSQYPQQTQYNQPHQYNQPAQHPEAGKQYNPYLPGYKGLK
jgi:hypothetical protein